MTSGDIDLRYKTAQRKSLGISIMGLADNFIRFTGSLAQPKVDVNVGGFVRHGRAAVHDIGSRSVGVHLMKRPASVGRSFHAFFAHNWAAYLIGDSRTFGESISAASDPVPAGDRCWLAPVARCGQSCADIRLACIQHLRHSALEARRPCRYKRKGK